MITLTRERLLSSSTNKGGFNWHQLQILGVEWPPKQGWLSDLLGTEVSNQRWELFFKLKGVKNKRDRMRIIKQYLGMHPYESLGGGQLQEALTILDDPTVPNEADYPGTTQPTTAA